MEDASNELILLDDAEPVRCARRLLFIYYYPLFIPFLLLRKLLVLLHRRSGLFRHWRSDWDVQFVCRYKMGDIFVEATKDEAEQLLEKATAQTSEVSISADGVS